MIIFWRVKQRSKSSYTKSHPIIITNCTSHTHFQYKQNVDIIHWTNDCSFFVTYYTTYIKPVSTPQFIAMGIKSCAISERSIPLLQNVYIYIYTHMKGYEVTENVTEIRNITWSDHPWLHFPVRDELGTENKAKRE
jgi:hypothetical protein